MKLPKTYLYLVAIFLCVSSAGAAAAGAGKGKTLYCWTNSDGVKECGDRIPPEYSQEEHEELSKKTGDVVKETDRAKTDAEIAEANKQAAAKAEAAKAAKEQAIKDKTLLDTFTSVKDIETVRDSKVNTLETSITLAETRGKKLQSDLDSRIKDAAAAERAGKPPSARLLKDIDSLKRQIKTNDDYIANTRKEEEDVKSSYESDISRFKELKANK